MATGERTQQQHPPAVADAPAGARPGGGRGSSGRCGTSLINVSLRAFFFFSGTHDCDWYRACHSASVAWCGLAREARAPGATRFALRCPRRRCRELLVCVAPAGVSLLDLQLLGLSEAVQRLGGLVALRSARGERN